MPSPRTLVSTLAAAALTSSVSADFGPAFSLGPVGGRSWIREATSTLVLPKAPTGGSNGDTALWVGMGTSNGDLIQSIASNHAASDWDIFAYTLVDAQSNTPHPVRSEGGKAQGSDRVTMHYKFDDKSGNYTQIVSVNGKQVSTISTSDGHAQGWGSAVECASGSCGTVAAHKWVDTKIILDSADPNFQRTLYKSLGAGGEMKTSDGGVTWTVSDITIPQHRF